MKKTELKRKTPLKGGTSFLKRSLLKIKPKRNPIPTEELAKVDERANGKCEWCDEVHTEYDYAHLYHRGMGGVFGKRALVINDHRNLVKVCRKIHDIMDKRMPYIEFSRNLIINRLKEKSGWFGWFDENRGVINR